MVSSIQSLADMEYRLYGSSGAGGYGLTTAPSVMNGYMMQSPYNNSYYYNYPYNSIYQANAMNYAQPTQTAAQAWGGGTYTKATPEQPTFQGFTQQDLDNLSNYYLNNNVLDEGFKGAATGGLGWMAWEHAQSIVHPVNAFFSKDTGARVAERIFKSVPKEFMKENQVLAQEAYTAIQQATRDTGSKWFYSGWLRNPIGKVHPGDEKKIETIVKELETDLINGNKKGVALNTSRLQAARGMDGKLIRKSKRLSVDQRLADKTANGSIAKKAAELESIASGNFGSLLKNSFKTNFLGWMGIEMLMGGGKILKGFQQDTETGLKQTGQTAGKAALGSAGWWVGRAAGTWLGAKAGIALMKVGATTGTTIAPGIGTLVGGLIGFTVGSIGMWLGHKLGNAIFGKDVADKAEAKEMTKTPEGQAQLLQFAIQKAQEGKNLDPGTQQAVQKALSMYA